MHKINVSDATFNRLARGERYVALSGRLPVDYPQPVEVSARSAPALKLTGNITHVGHASDAAINDEVRNAVRDESPDADPEKGYTLISFTVN